MLRWALDKNSKKLVSIIDAEKGIKCNCICPACGVKLVAHKAGIITHHFKHHRTDECTAGIETAIHLKAKEIIASAKKIKLPSLEARANYGEFTSFVPILTPTVIFLDEVRCEKKEGKIIPDIIATYKGNNLLIEIAVTHFVDRKKRNIIRGQGISCIEIDLHELHKSDKNITDKELAKHIIENTDNKIWIHNRKYFPAKKKALAQAILDEKTSIDEERIRAEERTKVLNDGILDMLRNEPRLIVNTDSIKQQENGSNHVEYDLNIELYRSFRGFESEHYEFLVHIFVCTDNDSMFFGNIEYGMKSVSNTVLESFIEKELISMAYQEGLSKWLSKTASN